MTLDVRYTTTVVTFGAAWYYRGIYDARRLFFTRSGKLLASTGPSSLRGMLRCSEAS